jgi:hypothetical protein
MKDTFTILFFVLFSFHFTSAQEHHLVLNPACSNVQSPFTSTHFIDNLADKQFLGYIQKGAFNRIEKIHYADTLPKTISKFFTQTNLSAHKPQELVIILNELFLSENTGDVSEVGRLRLSMRLFAETSPAKFSEILSVDSLYTVKGLDVTKKLLNSLSEQLCNIAAQAAATKLGMHENKAEYLLEELYKLDSLDKLHIPLYASKEMPRGIYKDFNHLKTNTPDDDSEIIIDAKKPDKIKVYKIYKASNRKIQLQTEGIYAVSDGQRLYKATSKNFYEVKKIGSDLFYERPAIMSEGNTGGLIGGSAFGLMGYMVGSAISDSKARTYRFKINYRRGNSIPVAMVE